MGRELALVVLLTAGVSVAAFRFGEPTLLLVLPILAWAAFRLGDLGVVLAGTAFAAAAPKPGRSRYPRAPGVPPLYADRDAYTQGQAVFDVGDIMVMYTDGLVERRGEGLDDGIGRVAEHLRAWPADAPLNECCDDLIASLAAEPQSHDICVLAVRRHEPAVARR